jgi:hypothetical protein
MRCSWLRWISVLALAGSAHAHEGWGVVVHPRHGVVVSDIPANTIWAFKDGRETALARDIHSHSLIAGADGAIYGTGTNSVWRLDDSGRVTTVMQIDPRVGLQSFLLARDGTVYSANTFDHRDPKILLMRRDRNGETNVIAPGFTGIDGMTEDDGAVVLADGPFLRRVTRHGVVSTIAGPLTERSFGEDLLGLSSIRNGEIHVADLANRRILRVRLRDGASEVVDHSSFLWAPSGVEVTGDAMYILEHIRPPFALLGDLQLGPYLRVRRGDDVLGTLWGRRTWIVAVIAILIAAAIVLIRKRSRTIP